MVSRLVLLLVVLVEPVSLMTPAQTVKVVTVEVIVTCQSVLDNCQIQLQYVLMVVVIVLLLVFANVVLHGEHKNVHCQSVLESLQTLLHLHLVMDVVLA